MDRLATYDSVLVTHSNHGPISYLFRNKRQKLQVFQPHAVNASAVEVRIGNF